MRLPAYAGAAGGGAVTACYRPLICISGLALARCLVSRFHGSLRGHRCDLCSSTWIKRLLSTSPVLLGRYLLCWAVDAIDGFAVANPLLGHSPRTGQLASRLSVPCANGAMSLICCFGDFCPFVPAAYTCLLGGRCHRWIRGRKYSSRALAAHRSNHFAPFCAPFERRYVSDLLSRGFVHLAFL